MALKNILDGSEKIIKIGFLSKQTSAWMGGVNYYKNLFIAMTRVNNPKLIPCILQPKDNQAKFLLSHSQIITVRKGLKYSFAKFLTLFTGEKFDKERVLYNELNIDLISHSDIFCDKPTVSWLADFQHIHMPEMFDEKELKDRSYGFNKLANHSKIVIMSSQDALNDFKNFTPQNSHKGRVLNFVAIPDSNIYKKTDVIKEKTIVKYKLPEKYFYLPNQFWKHKNHKVVFEAISLLKLQGTNINVIFTGGMNDYRNAGYFNELMGFAKDKNIENNIKLLGLIDLPEVYYLMRNCISIINPSFFEGWSSTVEEAKSLGKNIILSNINVHKEQNPPGGIYFDPHNSSELAEILKSKWEEGKVGPDFELEELAQEQLENRIIEFGKTYQKYVMEALEML